MTSPVTRITAEELRRRTLDRQFPALTDTSPAGVLELFERLGPIQSQVPRSPFLTAASRLPGTTYEAVREEFEAYELLRSVSIRGTVHTSTRAHFGRLDVISRQSRGRQARALLKLAGDPSLIGIEAERVATDWTQRKVLTAHLVEWLANPASPVRAAVGIGDVAGESVLWGHSGLIRRPPDTRWETRTDTLHRNVRSVLDDLEQPSPADSLVAAIRSHLRASGPVTREDLAFFFLARLTEVDQALTTLGAEIEPLQGPDGERLHDLVEQPPPGRPPTEPVLLPEFDALLLGYQGKNRTRFLRPDRLNEVWAKANGLFSPVVLAQERLVATWKTVTKGKRVDLEVTMLTGEQPLDEGSLTDAVAATELALGFTVSDLRILGRDAAVVSPGPLG